MQNIYAEMTAEVIVLWVLALAKFPDDVAVAALVELITEPQTGEEGRLVKPEPQMAVAICRRIVRERARYLVFSDACKLCGGAGWKPGVRGVTRCDCAHYLTAGEMEERRLSLPASPHHMEALPADVQEKFAGVAEKMDLNRGRARRPKTREESEAVADAAFRARKRLLKEQAEGTVLDSKQKAGGE